MEPADSPKNATSEPAWLDRVARTLEPVEIRQPSRPGDRTAAVLLPLVERFAPGRAATDAGEESTPHLLGMIRTDRGRHGGQFGLPGGRPEDVDTDTWDTALRETREELGLTHDVRRLGCLGEFNTVVSRFRVFVHIAYLPTPQPWIPQPGEAEAALEIPLETLVTGYRTIPAVDDAWKLPIEAGFEMDPTPYRVAGTIPPRGRGHELQTRRGPRSMPYIWGLTARILYTFLQRVWIPATEAGGSDGAYPHRGAE